MKPEENQISAPTPPPAELPLFPLSSWLYPGVSIGLRIFETRYLDMITRQLKQGAGFGVVPIKKGREVGQVPSIHPWGVEVEIIDWHQLSDGMLGITVQARRKFRVLDSEARPDKQLVATVAYVSDEEATEISDRYSGLADLLERLKEHPAAAGMELPEAANDHELSYQLSQLLPMSAEEKLAALAMTRADERLDFLAGKISDLAQQ